MTLSTTQLALLADWADSHDDESLWLAVETYYTDPMARELADTAWHDLQLGNPHRGEFD